MNTRAMVLGLVCLVALDAGCTRAHTVTKVKNPAHVTLAFRRIGSATIEPVTAGSADVNLRMSAIDVDEDGYLQREDGVLRIACNKCLGKSFTLLDGERLAASVDQSAEEIVSQSRGAGRIELPFEYNVSSAIDIYPTLRTPASNIEYFEQTIEPVSELGWLLVPGGVLFVVGLIVIPQDAVAGMLMFTPGLALSAFGGLHLVLPKETQRYNGSGRPIATRTAAPPPAPRTASVDDASEGDAADADSAGAEGEGGEAAAADPEAEAE